MKSEIRVYEAFLIPLLDDGYWLIARVNIKSKSIFVVESRPGIILPKYKVIKTLERVMCMLIPG